MCLNKCMYMYMYMYMYVYMYVYMHMHLYVYTYVRVHACTCACALTSTGTCADASTAHEQSPQRPCALAHARHDNTFVFNKAAHTLETRITQRQGPRRANTLKMPGV